MDSARGTYPSGSLGQEIRSSLKEIAEKKKRKKEKRKKKQHKIKIKLFFNLEIKRNWEVGLSNAVTVSVGYHVIEEAFAINAGIFRGKREAGEMALEGHRAGYHVLSYVQPKLLLVGLFLWFSKWVTTSF